ncbi:uncharacterized protein LOC117107518 [Anneissia japonica]|uniref:uncharacterized protein LOC117107518 n=1 Tax=Anneissia japonica TaxID=1529436 RepID=UPI0014257D35|nr:uncharacterized protein LOC117107518 [Anneissia japonica]
MSIATIDFARENGIILLSFPPHTSHKLQPLDRSVYGPFKTYLKCAQGTWLRNHPGERMTMHDIPGLVNTALTKANTPANIINGFRKCGIYPYNSDIFDDHEFAPAEPTDQPLHPNADDAQQPDALELPQTAPEQPPIVHEQPPAAPRDQLVISPPTRNQVPEPMDINDEDVPSTSSASFRKQLTFSSEPNFSPEVIRPLPKAPAKQKTTTKRRTLKTAILRDTPEKEAIRIRKENSTKNKGKKSKNQKKKVTEK